MPRHGAVGEPFIDGMDVQQATVSSSHGRLQPYTNRSVENRHPSALGRAEYPPGKPEAMEARLKAKEDPKGGSRRR